MVNQEISRIQREITRLEDEIDRLDSTGQQTGGLSRELGELRVQLAFLQQVPFKSARLTEARRVVGRLLHESEFDVVNVVEDGTADPFQAIYINGKLVVANPRRESGDILDALGIRPRVRLLDKGFDGNFPENLRQLKTRALQMHCRE